MPSTRAHATARTRRHEEQKVDRISARTFNSIMPTVIISRVAAVLLSAAITAACGSSRRAGPVILISIDTVRADHLPMYGYRAVRTPALDALAADAIVFENAYAHSPQTLPS